MLSHFKASKMNVALWACGFLSFVAVSISLSMMPKPQVAAIETCPVVVAADLIEIAVEITEDNAKVVQWPAEYVPNDVLSSLEEAKQLYAKVRLFKGQAITFETLENEFFRDSFR